MIKIVKRYIIACLTVIFTLISLNPVLAVESPAAEVACLESADGTVLGTYATVQLAINKVSEDGQVVKLLKDTSVQLRHLNHYSGWSASGLVDYNDQSINPNPSRIDCLFTLDLNGHTITFTDCPDSNMWGMDAITLPTASIKNGKVIFDFEPLSPVFYTNNGILMSNTTVLENLEIITTPGNQLYSVVYYNGTASGGTLHNCTIDNDGGNILPPMYDTTAVTIVSGCYRNLDLNNCTIAEGSQIYPLDGVDATVIISQQTEGIVVKDGRAYTYDDIESAQAAATASEDAKLLKRVGSEFKEINIDTGNVVAHVSSEKELLALVSDNGQIVNTDIVLQGGFSVSQTIYITGGVLDLNGQTVIIKPNGISAVQMVGGKIINGTLIIDCSDIKPNTCGIYSSSSEPTALENVEIITEQGKGLEAAVIIIGSMQIDNCVMVDVNISENGSMFKSENASDFTISSGSYKDLSHSSSNGQSSSSGSVSPANGSSEVPVNGIASTVIVSDSTKAIVVKDDKVYTYGSIEDAQASSGGADSTLLEKNERGDFVSSTTEIQWKYDTDSGYYLTADTKSGIIRFLFDTYLNPAEIKSSGIKFARSSDITESIDSSEYLSGKASAFYGDIVDIAETDNNETYYAIAYAELTNGTVIWSDVISCTPNFNNILN